MSSETSETLIGTILICDDDDAVRKVTKLMQKRIGYHVIDTASGAEALVAFQQNKTIDFVLVDMSMPEMDGLQLFRELKKVDPHVQVVLSSGYSQSEISEKYPTYGFKAFLQKPYSLKHLQLIFTTG